VVKIDAERAQYWISKGAKPSETVRSLLKKKAS
jgi:ribosomal protein S16